MSHQAEKFPECNNTSIRHAEGTFSPPANRETASESNHRDEQVAHSHPDLPGQAQIIIIEKRALLSDCLVGSLRAFGRRVLPFPDIGSWLAVAEFSPVSLVVLCLESTIARAEAHRSASLLLGCPVRHPVVILADAEEPIQIVDALEQGVRGYISTNMPLQVVIEAMQLVQLGGQFVPASSFMAAARSGDRDGSSNTTSNGFFTVRQAAIVEALRRGKANKVIAYELNMRESTVKVHIRKIMKKLNAKNRTEVAFLANSAMNETSRPRGFIATQ
jgi:DNA-binding NarL/FixJ family response regulator